MPEVLSPFDPNDAENNAFPETRQTLLARIQGADESSAESAIREFCEAYGPPLYTHAERKFGQAGRDMVHSFLEGFLRQKASEGPLKKFVPDGAKSLRRFILVCFKNHARGILDRDETGKRAHEAASQQRQIDSPEEVAADLAYDRDWARMLVDRVLAQLQAEANSQGQGDFFQVMIRRMREGREETTYVQLAEDFGMKDTAVRKRAARMRKRFQELFRREVRETVESNGEVDAEIAFLMNLLSRP